MRTLGTVLVAALALASAAASPQYETKWFTQELDHFDFSNTATFQQRYLISKEHWKPGGPVFFYTGNEGNITLFAENTEHRYYGATMPFGSSTYSKPSNLQWLSSEQALADYAALVESLKVNVTGDCPFVAFGGSYGGMLTAWARMKYPGTFAGGIAASAPIWQFTGLVDPRQYMSIITRDFHDANANASAGIAASWGIMEGLASTPSGLSTLNSIFSPCQPLATPDDVTGTLFQWISNALGFMAMADYPYPASFLGPMPGSPINVSASYFTGSPADMGDKALLLALRGVMNVFYNSSGQEPTCFNTGSLNPPGLRVPGWNYQSCTEMVMPIGQYGPPSDMFWPAPWNLTQDVQGCQEAYGITPRPGYVAVHYGGKHLAQYSNIVFTNGDLDPWKGGGVTYNVTGGPEAGVIAYVIKGGAHHLDLRSPNPLDPPSVIEARNIERAHIRKWIANWAPGSK